MQRATQDKNSGNNDRRLAAEAGQSLVWLQNAGDVKRNYHQDCDQISANPFGDKQENCPDKD
jgi:hypothetical protein